MNAVFVDNDITHPTMPAKLTSRIAVGVFVAGARIENVRGDLSMLVPLGLQNIAWLRRECRGYVARVYDQGQFSHEGFVVHAIVIRQD